MPRKVTRREFVHAGLTASAAGLAITPSAAGAAQPERKRDPDSVLAKLIAGNKRFMKGEVTQPRRKPEDFVPLAEGQAPLAVVVGCADSRVSPELVFDVGIGDLFVVRIAGNVVSGAGASVKGSIEYAVAELGVQLIVVLGHSKCGAVKAAIKHIDDNDKLPGSLDDLINTIRPACVTVQNDAGDKLENVTKEYVRRGVERLTGLKPILSKAVEDKKLKVVGGVYDLKTGEVKILS